MFKRVLIWMFLCQIFMIQLRQISMETYLNIRNRTRRTRLLHRQSSSCWLGNSDKHFVRNWSQFRTVACIETCLSEAAVLKALRAPCVPRHLKARTGRPSRHCSCLFTLRLDLLDFMLKRLFLFTWVYRLAFVRCKYATRSLNIVSTFFFFFFLGQDRFFPPPLLRVLFCIFGNDFRRWALV